MCVCEFLDLDFFSSALRGFTYHAEGVRRSCDGSRLLPLRTVAGKAPVAWDTHGANGYKKDPNSLQVQVLERHQVSKAAIKRKQMAEVEKVNCSQ